MEQPGAREPEEAGQPRLGDRLLASDGWLKLILLRVSQESPKVAVWGADRPFEHLHTSSTAHQTYPKTDTGPNDDNGTAGATGLGLYV